MTSSFLIVSKIVKKFFDVKFQIPIKMSFLKPFRVKSNTQMKGSDKVFTDVRI
jgi:hypothetical protein